MSVIMVTGGTGSLGSYLIDFLHKADVHHNFVVFSRDEQKQYRMALRYPDDPRVFFVLGDVRDQQSVSDAVAHYKPDVVVHTAAQKHVKICEHNPMQTVLTNIHGTKHVVRACLANDVRAACFVSTDKVIAPRTLYGMTKNIAEHIWANASKKKSNTRFVGVRYGNILNSAGSLIPLYLHLMKQPNPVFPVTDERMTRFFITFSQAIGLIIHSIIDGINQDPRVFGNIEINSPPIHTIDREIFRIPKLPSIKIKDIAEIFAEHVNGEVEVIGAFESEKLSESMVDGYDSADGPFASKKEVKELLITEGLLPSGEK